jgi:hypothetical protein
VLALGGAAFLQNKPPTVANFNVSYIIYYWLLMTVNVPLVPLTTQPPSHSKSLMLYKICP